MKEAPAAASTVSIRPQAVGWWILAVLAALAAIAATGLALVRQSAAESTDDPTGPAITVNQVSVGALAATPARGRCCYRRRAGDSLLMTTR